MYIYLVLLHKDDYSLDLVYVTYDEETAKEYISKQIYNNESLWYEYKKIELNKNINLKLSTNPY